MSGISQKKYTRYVLNENVRVLYGEDEIRLRTGIWNYDEAVINLRNESEDFKKCLSETISYIENGKVLSSDFLGKCDKKIRTIILSVLEELKNKNFISTEKDGKLSHDIASTLIGFHVKKSVKENNKGLIFISDNDYCMKNAFSLSNSLQIKLDIMPKETINKMQRSDLTTKMDTVSTIEKLDELKKNFSSYSAVISCFFKPSIIMFRNLNRVLVDMEKPSSFAFVDGPFVTMFTIWPPYTGCFECFELRSLSRLEDHVNYQKFVNSNNLFSKSINIGFAPLLNVLSSFVISEGFLISKIGTSKFMGRVLNIYIPTFEIQVQDILRVPFCPACGYVSKATNREINVSSNTIINKLISEAISKRRKQL